MILTGGELFTLKLGCMRDRDTIDAELRLLAAVRWSIREHGGGCCFQ
jgi:hypothetical protein